MLLYRDTINFDSDKFVDFLRTILPNSTQLTNIETEVIYSLETETRIKSEFIQDLIRLLENIENRRKPLNIDSFGLSYSTLEDIFLLVGSDINGEEFNPKLAIEPHCDSKLDDRRGDRRSHTKSMKNANKAKSNTTRKNSKSNSRTDKNNQTSVQLLTRADELYQGYALIAVQIFGIFMKRFHYARRNLFLIIFQLIVIVHRMCLCHVQH